MNAKAGRGSDQFMLRLPEGMRDRIKLSADRNSRSMNAEIVATLDKAYPAADYEALAYALVEVLQHMPDDESKALTDLINQRIAKWTR
ncbi:Arc family DNA-binding protein [Paracoccus gahaiensis]|uniref:Arc family DNA-binding protein n=1 Tax=Paracoccus gahaiensis TaxID=1706839 RepID=A0A4U0RTA2_9RHOB|nr:Arc family DNA-binding protein [Paracoccus gahaiensis]TJZ91604.1 Arc family DNA-binding protein [Paracoccus gahaiensis]